MGNPIADLESFSRKPVRFRCKPPVLSPAVANYPAVIRKAMGVIPPPGSRFETTVTHELRGPASFVDLKTLRSLLGVHAPPYEAFFGKHDGFELYKDSHSNSAGIEAIKIGDWRKATKFMCGMVGDVAASDDPANVLKGVAFATALQSGNFFAVPVKGEMAGKIFYVDHDDWGPKLFANDFDDFLRQVMGNPIALFLKLGGSMRYSDGAGCTQWIAEEVV